MATIPVIFIHGRNAGPGVWGAMISFLKSKGYTQDQLFAWSYDTSLSTNEKLSDQLKMYVKKVLTATGAERVDIVAHSLGSLPSRWYIKFSEGSSTVRNWISLAGPNHGTQVAWGCALWDQGCRDMTPGSYVISNLNAGDETPGAVGYATLWSSGDGQILPNSSTLLAGAQNIEVSAMGHNDLLTSSEVFNHVLTLLA
jgi:triacylglycerol esterase/lipase EstA (alpha/beta hydrolase family)